MSAQGAGKSDRANGPHGGGNQHVSPNTTSFAADAPKKQIRLHEYAYVAQRAMSAHAAMRHVETIAAMAGGPCYEDPDLAFRPRGSHRGCSLR
jgi:hypothetical protein